MSRQIVSMPDVLGGEFHFSGTRISVRNVGLRVWAGATYKELEEDFPKLDGDDYDAAVDWLTFADKLTWVLSQPFGRCIKRLVIWSLDAFDNYILRHRSYWVCHKIATSTWW